jgi:Fe-S cluster assembly protein SufD
LPTRRSEAWRYSDLNAALGGVAPPLAGDGDIIERLAAGAGQVRALEVGAGERRVVVEELSAEPFAPCALNVRVGAGGSLQRLVLQGGGGVQLSRCQVALERGAGFRQFVIATGAKFARIETHVEIEGEGAHIELNGAYLCAEGHHADLTSVVTHKAPGSQTKQLIKGVARKGGRGVFQGKIVVEREAQKTDARQHHQGMLLEDGAEIFAKPELMIFADDVACAHGNTAGGLDANALFYLRARGVAEAEARALLTEAFLLEAVPDWVAGDMRTEIEARIGAWLRGAP